MFVKLQIMKTTKIAPGYYKFDYKGYNVTLTKLDYPDTEWYFELGNGGANDYHSTKKIAIEAAIEFIDYLEKS